MEIFVFTIINIFVGLILIYLIGFYTKRKRGTLSKHNKRKFLAYWNDIKNSSDYYSAIINADKLLYNVLIKMGSTGTMAEMLKENRILFSDINGLFDAHKARNRIVHDMDVVISSSMAKKFLKSFDRAFKDLGIK